MTVDVHVIAFNEADLLPECVRWYRERLSVARFVVHDNRSTDSTARLVVELGCDIVPFDTDGEYREDVNIGLKNECWRGTEADWVVVCDVDEFLDVDDEILSLTKADVVQGVGFDMVGTGEPIPMLSRGVRAPLLDKMICFRPSTVSDINFGIGAHTAQPRLRSPSRSLLVMRRPLYHFKWLSPEYVVSRYHLFRSRRGSLSLREGWGTHYEQTHEQIAARFDEILVEASVVRFPRCGR